MWTNLYIFTKDLLLLRHREDVFLTHAGHSQALRPSWRNDNGCSRKRRSHIKALRVACVFVGSCAAQVDGRISLIYLGFKGPFPKVTARFFAKFNSKTGQRLAGRALVPWVRGASYNVET